MSQQNIDHDHELDLADRRWARMKKQRDEWKRRCERAEALLQEAVRISEGAVPFTRDWQNRARAQLDGTAPNAMAEAASHVDALLTWLERIGADTTGHPAVEWVCAHLKETGDGN